MVVMKSPLELKLALNEQKKTDEHEHPCLFRARSVCLRGKLTTAGSIG